MKPKNKVEKKVVALSPKLPQLSPKQENWAKNNFISIEDAYKRSSRMTVSSFLVVTTYKGWQVIRFFMMYTKVSYHKPKYTHFVECFQHWLKNGKYVFLAKPRRMGYINDAFIPYAPMTVKREYCSYLGDPRDTCGWQGIYYAKVQKCYKYIMRDRKDIDIDILMRMVNASQYNETLIRNHPNVWEMSRIKGFIFNTEKTAAIKIAMRYKYNITPEWWDMIDNLYYLGKDLHNPALVCPTDLKTSHDKWLQAASRRRERMSEKMTKLRQISDERRELRRIEEQERILKKQEEEARSIAKIYGQKRSSYFGIDITDGTIHIKALQSIEEFFEEGKEMCHCVFSNRYYDVIKKPMCLILSAKINGERIETIEIDLRTFSIVQSRGKHNQNSQYHDKIIALLKNHMWQIKNANHNLANAV